MVLTEKNNVALKIPQTTDKTKQEVYNGISQYYISQGYTPKQVNSMFVKHKKNIDEKIKRILQKLNKDIGVVPPVFAIRHILKYFKKLHQHHKRKHKNFDDGENFQMYCESCQNYDESQDINGFTTLEEHFENFTDGVVDVAENFLGLGKRAKERKQARQEKRLSRIRGRQELREARIQAKIEGLKPKPTLEAQQQADQVNQLQSQVQPSAQPVTPQQTPSAQTASADQGGQEQLYKTLPMPGEEQAQQQPQSTGETLGFPTGTDTGTEGKENEQEVAEITKETEKPKSNKMIIYVVIAVALLGAWYLMKRKK